MNIKPLLKGAYYSVRYIAGEFDNVLSLCVPAAHKPEYQKFCYENAVSIKNKAKENFRLAFQKDISDRV